MRDLIRKILREQYHLDSSNVSDFGEKNRLRKKLNNYFTGKKYEIGKTMGTSPQENPQKYTMPHYSGKVKINTNCDDCFKILDVGAYNEELNFPITDERDNEGNLGYYYNPIIEIVITAQPEDKYGAIYEGQQKLWWRCGEEYFRVTNKSRFGANNPRTCCGKNDILRKELEKIFCDSEELKQLKLYNE